MRSCQFCCDAKDYNYLKSLVSKLEEKVYLSAFSLVEASDKAIELRNWSILEGYNDNYHKANSAYQKAKRLLADSQSNAVYKVHADWTFANDNAANSR